MRSATSQIVAVERCSTRQDLLRSLVSAMDRVLDLGALEVAAATNGKPFEELNRIERDLRDAMDLKKSILDQYRTHVQSHHCK